MKMVKSLLLVSAAGLVAVSGAQAADLPVKAKAVEYVKVCSLYGAGFYYVPGTDICQKIGAYIRFQESFGHGDITAGPFGGTTAINNRVASADQIYRSRYILTHDTRQQTAYGTLRTYMILGASSDSTGANAVALYSTRAFIQIAGFTFGKATSYFDFVSTAAVAYNAGSLSAPDTGDGGHIVVAYTAQLGNGFSATLSVEQERTRGTNFLGTAVTGGGSAVSGTSTTVVSPNYAGAIALQDIVGNLRVDQAWGSAMIAAAAHNVSASYYGSAAGVNESNGRPSDEWGYAFTGGIRLNMPMIAPGDYLQAAFVYANGATRYASNSPGDMRVRNGQSVGGAFMDDAGFTGTSAAPGIFEKTKSWSVMASYEHFWTPSLRTSVYGSYFNISRSDTLNDALCASGLVGTQLGATGGTASRALGCDLNSSYWALGSRTQWNITKDLYMGMDVIYSKLNTAKLNATNVVNLAAASGIQAGTYRVEDQSAVSATWRIHRDIVP